MFGTASSEVLKKAGSNKEANTFGKGNTSVYLMYAYARCRNILNKVNNLDEVLESSIDVDTPLYRRLLLEVLK
jgi:arginyl-tRNA synthetase